MQLYTTNLLGNFTQTQYHKASAIRIMGIEQSLNRVTTPEALEGFINIRKQVMSHYASWRLRAQAWNGSLTEVNGVYHNAKGVPCQWMNTFKVRIPHPLGEQSRVWADVDHIGLMDNEGQRRMEIQIRDQVVILKRWNHKGKALMSEQFLIDRLHFALKELIRLLKEDFDDIGA